MTKPRTHVLDIQLDTGRCITLCGRVRLWVDKTVVAASASDCADCRQCERTARRREEKLTQVRKLLGTSLARKFARYIDNLLRTWHTAESIASAVRSLHHQDSEIEAGRCPECGKPIKRYGAAETRRLRNGSGLGHGPRVAVVGDWVMYRCSTQRYAPGQRPAGVPRDESECGFMLDRFEAEEAN